MELNNLEFQKCDMSLIDLVSKPMTPNQSGKYKGNSQKKKVEEKRGTN